MTADHPATVLVPIYIPPAGKVLAAAVPTMAGSERRARRREATEAKGECNTCATVCFLLALAAFLGVGVFLLVYTYFFVFNTHYSSLDTPNVNMTLADPGKPMLMT